MFVEWLKKLRRAELPIVEDFEARQIMQDERHSHDSGNAATHYSQQKVID